MKLLSLAALILLAAPLIAQDKEPAPAPGVRARPAAKKPQAEKEALAWETDEAAAFKKAADEKKQVFIYFWHGGG